MPLGLVHLHGVAARPFEVVGPDAHEDPDVIGRPGLLRHRPNEHRNSPALQQVFRQLEGEGGRLAERGSLGLELRAEAVPLQQRLAGFDESIGLEIRGRVRIGLQARGAGELLHLGIIGQGRERLAGVEREEERVEAHADDQVEVGEGRHQLRRRGKVLEENRPGARGLLGDLLQNRQVVVEHPLEGQKESRPAEPLSHGPHGRARLRYQPLLLCRLPPRAQVHPHPRARRSREAGALDEIRLARGLDHHRRVGGDVQP